MIEYEQTKLRSCAVCGLKIVEATSSFCSRHAVALRKLTKAYDAWEAAYDGISKKDFLERVVALAETGNEARDVARLLIEHSDRWK